jgi:hypothetical protein
VACSGIVMDKNLKLMFVTIDALGMLSTNRVSNYAV